MTCPLRRGRYLILAAGCLIGSLLGAPAGAASFYEQTKNVYHSLQGTEQEGVDVYTGAFQFEETFGTIPSVLNIPAGWQFVSQDDTNGPFGKGTSTLTDVFVEWKAATSSYEFVGPGNRRFVMFRQGTGTPAVYADTRSPEMLGATFTLATPTNGHSGTLRWKTGKKFFFNAAGELHRVEDKFGTGYD